MADRRLWPILETRISGAEATVHEDRVMGVAARGRSQTSCLTALMMYSYSRNPFSKDRVIQLAIRALPR